MTGTRIQLRPVDHFTGARFTRRTWQAVVIWWDGRETPCGHERHPTTDHAIRCGRATWRRGLGSAS